MVGNDEILRTCTDEATFENGIGFAYRDYICKRELLEKIKNYRSDNLIVQCSVRGRDGGARPLAKKAEAWTRFLEDRSCIEWRLKFFENLHSVIGRRCFYLGDMLYEMEAKAHREDVISIRRLWKTSSDVVVDVNGKMIILDAQGNAEFSLEGGNLFNPNDGPENYDSFFHKKGLNKIVKERKNKMMKGMEGMMKGMEGMMKGMVWNVRRLWKTSSEVKVYGKMIILDVKGHVMFSLEGWEIFNSNDGPGYCDSFIQEKGLNKIVKERLNEMMEGSEIIFRFEFHLDSEVIIGSKAETNNCFSIESILNVTDDLQNLLTRENHSDVELKAGNKVMKAHRSVLAARSPVFSAMFDSDMLESRTGTVDIEDVDENALASFLRFLYTGTVDYEKASALLLVAEKYQVPSLKEDCCYFLISNLCVENICNVLVQADMVQDENLKNTCLDFIATYVAYVFKSPSWIQMMKENVKLASEVTLYIGEQCAKK